MRKGPSVNVTLSHELPVADDVKVTCFDKLPEAVEDYKAFDKAMKLKKAKSYFESTMLRAPVRGQPEVTIELLTYSEGNLQQRDKHVRLIFSKPVKFRGGVVLPNRYVEITGGSAGETHVHNNPSIHTD